jgi:hypothetical protein
LFKGQVSTEYLVILAVVLVVALVVVALVSGVTPVSGGVSDTQSKNYWSATSPLKISEWKYSGTSLQLTLESTDAKKITITDISIEGSSVYSTNTTYTIGESKSITATMSSACVAGELFELSDVTFTYSKDGVDGLTQRGDKPIVGTCS